MASQHFRNEHCITIIYENVNYLNKSIDVVDYVNSLEQTLNEIYNKENLFSFKSLITWIYIDGKLNFENNLRASRNIGCKSFITIINDVNKFLTIKRKINDFSKIRGPDRKFLFLLNFFHDFNRIFQHSDISFFPSHVIVLPILKEGNEIIYELWTQKYTGLNDTNIGIKLNTFYSNLTFALNNKKKKIYYNKFKNMEGRVLNISTMSYIPYISCKNVSPGQGNFNSVDDTNNSKTILFEGTEAILMQEFCLLKNCTLRIKRFDDNFWGTIDLDNGTNSDGMLGSLYKKEVDFSIGCIYKWYYDVLDISTSIAKSSVTVLVPAAKPLPSSLTPTLPFSALVWLLVVGTFLLNILALYFVQIFKLDNTNKKLGKNISFTKTALIIVAIFFQQSVYIHPKLRNFNFRLMFGVFCISFIVLSYSYSGGLASVLTVPRFKNKIKTIEEFSNSGYDWGAPDEAWILSLEEVTEPIIQGIVKHFHVWNTKDLREYSLHKSIGIAVERLNSGNVAFGSYVQNDIIDRFDILKENIYFDYTVTNSVRGWPLMPDFDQFVLKVTQHGLYDYWETKMVYKYLDYKVQIGMQSYITRGNKKQEFLEKLNTSHISGPLILWSLGMLASVIIFLIEILVKKIHNK